MSQTPVKELTKRYNHNEILSVCGTLFYQKGYENTTSDDIARTAGYSKRTIYVYFPSKEAILEQLKTDSLNRLCEEINRTTFTCLEDFLQCVRSFLIGNPQEHYYIKRISFQKNREQDYFLFSEKFSKLITLLASAYHFTSPSLDIPLIIWNTLLYAIENDIPISRISNFLLNGISGSTL